MPNPSPSSNGSRNGVGCATDALPVDELQPTGLAVPMYPAVASPQVVISRNAAIGFVVGVAGGVALTVLIMRACSKQMR